MSMEAEKQEPVAWMNKHGACKTSLFREVEAGAKDEYTVPLYPHPQPKREPVIDKSAAIRIATALGWEPKREPLTDEQIEKAIDAWFKLDGSYQERMRAAIEAAHGIKGEA